jgi:ribosomal protein S18 acetylase RimI-like enzyme
LKFLIDTNVFIPLEPTGLADVEPGTGPAALFMQDAIRGRHQVYVHPAALRDIERDTNEERRELRRKLLAKYPPLPDPPAISEPVANELGNAARGSNDWVDHCLIAALQAEAVDFLVTEDMGLRRKAERIGLAGRVATVYEAHSVIRDLFDQIPPPPPAVEDVKAHALDQGDPIFDSLRDRYPGFDDWLSKCKREHRQAWIIRGRGARYAGLCIVNPETDPPVRSPGKVLKICTLKVCSDFSGSRFGELLLKTVFEYASRNGYDSMFVTTFAEQERLIALLREFGFDAAEERTELGELILSKSLTPADEDRSTLDGLAFNIKYGPFAVKFEGAPTFAVPILPVFHRVLFPEAEQQSALFPGVHSCGNSIRKAYLSNSASVAVASGANLLFYRSRDAHAVTAIGVVEGIERSDKPDVIARYVGKRTVYRYSEIERLCRNGPVLAILFRQARILEQPIELRRLEANGLLKAAPQTITRVPEEATEWLQRHLAT